MLAPIVLFVYNRLDHTQGVIETLSKNLLAKESELYVFSDAAKSENGLGKVNEVREYIRDDAWHGNFKEVTIIEAEKNKGLANSVIGGVTKIIHEYGKVIVVEDDLILSPYFLNYMNDALDYYQDDEKIWSISGYSFPMKSLKKYPHDIFYSYRGCSWGWATWNDRWNLVDWEVKDYQATTRPVRTQHSPARTFLLLKHSLYVHPKKPSSLPDSEFQLRYDNPLSSFLVASSIEFPDVPWQTDPLPLESSDMYPM